MRLYLKGIWYFMKTFEYEIILLTKITQPSLASKQSQHQIKDDLAKLILSWKFYSSKSVDNFPVRDPDSGQVINLIAVPLYPDLGICLNTVYAGSRQANNALQFSFEDAWSSHRGQPSVLKVCWITCIKMYAYHSVCDFK